LSLPFADIDEGSWIGGELEVQHTERLFHREMLLLLEDRATSRDETMSEMQEDRVRPATLMLERRAISFSSNKKSKGALLWLW
jgi:hypothetical protein